MAEPKGGRPPRRLTPQELDAQTAASEAQTAQAAAETERIRAQAAAAAAAAALEQTRIQAQIQAEQREAASREAAAKAARDRREADRLAAQQARERLYQVGIQVTAMGAGAVLGKRLATGIERRHIAHLNARAPQLAQVGYQAQQLLKAGANGYISQAQRSQLAGLVRAADRAGLTRIRGPLGVAMGGLLVGEALFARMVVAPNLDNPTAREAVNQLSTLSIFAATNLIGTRLMQNRTLGTYTLKQSPISRLLRMPAPKPQTLTFPNIKAIGAIESARAVVNQRVPQAAADTVQAARTAATRVTAATRTVGAVRSGVMGALSSPGVQTARTVIARGARYGLAGVGLATLGYVASQSSAGQQAIGWVRGFWRTNPSGQTSYVQPHRRSVT